MCRHRIRWIDEAKGWGIVFVIILHLGVGKMGEIISSFVMPLFFFLSGYVAKIDTFTFKQLISNAIKKRVIPYFLLASVMILFTWADNDYSLNVLFVTLKGVCFQKRSWTIWYLACLVWVELLAWLICKFTRLAILRIAIAFLCLIVVQIYYRLGGSSLFWDFDIAWMAVSFYMLGKEKVYITVPTSNLGLKKGIIVLCIFGCCFFLNSQISHSFLNLGGG